MHTAYIIGEVFGFLHLDGTDEMFGDFGAVLRAALQPRALQNRSLRMWQNAWAISRFGFGTTLLGGGFRYLFIFIPYLGKISILTIIFQTG